MDIKREKSPTASVPILPEIYTLKLTPMVCSKKEVRVRTTVLIKKSFNLFNEKSPCNIYEVKIGK